MTDFPRSLIAFQRQFPDDGACSAWLYEQRWPDGFVCPGCGGQNHWMLEAKTLKTGAAMIECAACHHQTSVTAGTVLHGSKLPLTVWFLAAYLMTTHSNGISALQLQHQLGIGSCQYRLAAMRQAAPGDGQPGPLCAGRECRG